jgi:hypothetical protein
MAAGAYGSNDKYPTISANSRNRRQAANGFSTLGQNGVVSFLNGILAKSGGMAPGAAT